MIIWIAIIAGVVALDQVSKLLIVNFLDRNEPFVVIEGIFRFNYVENRGAAFGSFSDNRWVFMIISTVTIIALLIYMWKFRPDSRLACTALSFIIGGGVGNMIDRVYLGYVVDFIDFYAFPNLWKWVFNVADSFVCIGAGMMILWCIISMIDEGKKAKAEKIASEASIDTDDMSNTEE
ncbi:MAG: signal peptidase II [Clostridia bacterium]|nr:signal peptidase II [Clostridia bacterium]